MITGVNPKILLMIEDQNKNWKLVREHDELTKHSADILWLEWNNDRSFKAKHNTIAIGRSLLMSPFNKFFTWQTTVVTEIIKIEENYFKFETENSNYELWKIKND